MRSIAFVAALYALVLAIEHSTAIDIDLVSYLIGVGVAVSARRILAP